MGEETNNVLEDRLLLLPNWDHAFLDIICEGAESCSLAPGVVAGLLKALEIVEREPERRRRLWDNTDYLQQALRDRNVDVGLSESQVIPIMIRDDDRIFSVAEDMIHEGVYLNPVRYPAVGKHRSRLRISVTSDHARDELTEGADIIARVLERHGFLCP